MRQVLSSPHRCQDQRQRQLSKAEIPHSLLYKAVHEPSADPAPSLRRSLSQELCVRLYDCVVCDVGVTVTHMAWGRQDTGKEGQLGHAGAAG